MVADQDTGGGVAQMKFISGTSHVCATSCACVAACGRAREDWAAYWEDHENGGGIIAREWNPLPMPTTLYYEGPVERGAYWGVPGMGGFFLPDGND